MELDLVIMLKKVTNLSDYISVTQKIVALPRSKMKIQFNMSSVLLLKKVRSLEIEYFNKCEGNGAALSFFGRMLEQPPSQTWGLLGKELAALLQYWLDALRKHLIKHSQHWWTFLKLLLKFIKTMRVKDTSLPDILVEGTAECLLDLATSSEPDTIQRYEILYCLNLCCAESSREIRFALRNRLESYFVKLGRLQASCGHLPAQHSMLEALLRWQLPRHEAGARRAALGGWLPAPLYPPAARRLFLERPWQNFFQDARDFLNALNTNGNLVTSFLCRKISVGAVAVVSGTEKRETWLDLNSYDGSATIVLDPRFLDALCVPDAPAWETLSVLAQHVRAVQLRRDTSEVTLQFHTTQPPRLNPSDAVVAEACELTVVLSSATDLRRLDTVLRDAYKDKYQVLLDLNKPTSLSPQEKYDNRKTTSAMDEEAQFSHPVQVQKRKRSGFVVLPRNQVAWKSPSSVSTSSLAQLHEKLESLPQYTFDKEAVPVCAKPELSTVTEVSETDDLQSNTSLRTFKTKRRIGVCHRNNKSSERNSQSDSEVHNKSKVWRHLSPTGYDENSTSCLLVATLGTADESVINDTIERLSKHKDYHGGNIVDLLVQEALQKDYNASIEKDLRDSGIITGDRKTQEPPETNSEAIENTPAENPKAIVVQNKVITEKVCTVISNTTTDESNDVVYDTPLNFVNVRKRKVVKENVSQKPDAEKILDVTEVEAFFTQHISENNRGDVVISPTLARKINETSSESEEFDDCLIIHEDNNVNVEQIDVYDVDVVECLNSIVDKVCSDLEKCIESLGRIDNTEKSEDKTESVESKEADTKSKKSIKLTFNTKRMTRARTAKKKKNKLDLEPANTSPVRDVHDNIVPAATIKTPEQTRKSPSSGSGDLNAALTTRRKRKLYSPKDEGDNERVIQVTEIDDDKDFKTSKILTPKYKATSYKDIEMDRQKRLNQPRGRKSKNKSNSTLSPRTKKMDDIFNQLKEKVECPEPVKVVDKKTLEKEAMYNFTSDSEDEDFKRKKIEVQKRMSSTTIASGDSTMSTKHGRPINRINYSETKSSDESNKKRAPRQKRSVKRKKTNPRSRAAKPEPALIDEKMREAVPEELNTSIVVERPSKNVQEQPNLILPIKPQMEPISDEIITEVKEKPKKNTRKNKKPDALSLKKEKKQKSNLIIEKDYDDRTISPLPGLNVEMIPTYHKEANDSVTANMLQKFQKIYQEGPGAINDSNATQTLLSDVENIDYSPPHMNITDELNQTKKGKGLKENNSSKTVTAKILCIKKEKAIEMKKQKHNATQEVINLTTISDDKSEVSIATVGKSPITAHRYSNESPPSPHQLTETIVPRDLEVEDLNESVIDYLNNLRSEVNDVPSTESRSDSIHSENTRTKIGKQSSNRSPVVSIARLTLEDISKWLPSRRNSDTDNSSSKETSKEIVKKNKPPSKSDKENTSSSYNKWLRSRKCINASGSVNLISPVKDIKRTAEKTKMVTPPAQTNRRSLISPIKLLDDFKVASQMPNEASSSTTVKKLESIISNFEEELIEKKHSKTISHDLDKQRICKSKNIEVSSLETRSTLPKKEVVLPMKRKSKSPVIGNVKRRKLDDPDIVSRSESGPSVSRVNEWLRGNAPDSREESVAASLCEHIENIMEKLDTTLAEIHEITSKRFIHMFVDAQQRLSSMRQERRNVYKCVAAAVLAALKHVAMVVDEKFADMDRRSQEMDAEFMEQFKAQASALIREECTRKRALLRLLREDLAATLARAKGKRGDTL